MRWEAVTTDWLVYVSGPLRMVAWPEPVDAPSTGEKLAFASFYSDIYEDKYVKPASLAKSCRDNNKNNNLPTPESLAAGYTQATRGNFLGTTGMNKTSCFMPTNVSWIMWFYPMANGQ